MILRADKGNAAVVMDSEEYDNKLQAMLNDSKTYQLLNKDPAKSCETRMKGLLSGMKDRIDEKTYRSLCTTDGNIPRLYGLPKIHKQGVPLRPIVSYVGSPTYQLSKYLVKILSPLVGNSAQHLKNSKEWVDLVQTLTLTDVEELVSFDVVSLFTSIPTDIAVSAAIDRLVHDSSLQERTNLTSADITSLLSFCLKSTEFSYRNKYYRQIHGTAMGSPISVTVANLVMEVIESKALSTFVAAPRIFKRHVDDTICVINTNQIDAFYNHLNEQDNNIKFTIERYSDGGLPFLDTLNKVSEDGRIKISIYRKKTHTDKYLDFDSHHPSSHKAAVVRTLAHRKETLLTDAETKKDEQDHLNNSLHQNGYPSKFIDKHSIIHRRRTDGPEETNQPKGFATLPYIKGTTERICRILSRHNIKCCIKPEVTLKRILSHPKDRVALEKQVGVVYSIPCGECDIKYIGETSRSLGTRSKEHQAAVRPFKQEKSALAVHVNLTGHSIDWNNANIVHSESKWNQRKWWEACCIAKDKNILFNRDSGRILPGNYINILNN